MRQAWTAPLPAVPEAPLATDGQRLYVTTRDGSLVALDLQRGERLWDIPEVPGRAAAAEGSVIVRQASGTVLSLHPRNGGARWKAESGVAGSLPPVIDGDLVLVAGKGVAALDRESGRVLWRATTGPRPPRSPWWPGRGSTWGNPTGPCALATARTASRSGCSRPTPPSPLPRSWTDRTGSSSERATGASWPCGRRTEDRNGAGR